MTIKYHQYRGFTLLEILLASVILSVGMLAVASLQLKSLRQNNSDFVRSQAIVLAYDMADRIRANKAGADANNYLVTIDKIPEGDVFAPQCGAGSVCDCDGVAGDGAGATCSTEQLAQWDIDTWEQSLKDPSVIPLGGNALIGCPTVAALPDGSICANGSCCVVVKWEELNPTPDPTVEDNDLTIEQSVTFEFRL